MAEQATNSEFHKAYFLSIYHEAAMKQKFWANQCMDPNAEHGEVESYDKEAYWRGRLDALEEVADAFNLLEEE